MCGIAGFTEPVGSEEYCTQVADSMLRRLKHRGPEGHKITFYDNITLGHSMLSYVPVGKNTQPILSENNRIQLVFNGEIYNYHEVSRSLSIDRGMSECEVLLAAYSRWGNDFIHRIRGMFAIVICDKENGRILLARDPFGKKPLYYFITGDGIVFGSELTSLEAHPECPDELNYSALGSYFACNAISAPSTIFKNIYKVKPGCIVTYSHGNTAEEMYCSSVPAAQNNHDYVENLHNLDAMLQYSVAKRYNHSSCETGIFLSGGLDSGLITVIAQRLSDKPLKTFSIGFKDRSFDESEYAKKIAEHAGADHSVYMSDMDDYLDVICHDYCRLDEPLADPSFVSMILLSRFARKKVKVVLSGDGADEMFLGYPFIFPSIVMHCLSNKIPSRSINLLRELVTKIKSGNRNMPFRYALLRVLQGFGSSTAAGASFNIVCGLTNAEQHSLVNDEIYREICIDGFLDKLSQTNEQNKLSRTRQIQSALIRYYLQSMINTKVDRSSMLYSLEVRSPFQDIDFAETVHAMSDKHKSKWGSGKLILKKVAERYLPNEIINRKKMGFRIPVAHFFRSRGREILRDVLSRQTINRYSIVRWKIVEKMIQDHISYRENYNKQLWSLFCLHLWLINKSQRMNSTKCGNRFQRSNMQ